MAERRYTKSHEWLTADGKTVTVGITDFAQSQLGDVVFLDLPAPGRKLAAGESFGVVESVKAASDLYSPVSGRITAVNEKLAAHPELINSDPYGDGWILKLELAGELPDGLLDRSRLQESRRGLATCLTSFTLPRTGLQCSRPSVLPRWTIFSSTSRARFASSRWRSLPGFPNSKRWRRWRRWPPAIESLLTG